MAASCFARLSVQGGAYLLTELFLPTFLLAGAVPFLPVLLLCRRPRPRAPCCGARSAALSERDRGHAAGELAALAAGDVRGLQAGADAPAGALRVRSELCMDVNHVRLSRILQ